MKNAIIWWFKKYYRLNIQKSNSHMIIITIAIVMIRRWVRWILDKFLFPNNELLSYITGIIIGLIIIYIDDQRVDELWHR